MASQATYVTTGSNTLRGGKNKYRAATLNDNWVEDRYDPKFDGVRPSAATTTRDMELEATQSSMPKYGAQFKKDSQFDDTINYKDTIGYDTMNYSDKWQTVTQSVHTNPGAAKATEFSTSFHMVDTELIASGKQDEYRERWTTDNTGADIKARYTSELNRSIKGSVASKFEERVMRKFPGVPKSVEDFRELLVKKYGDTAVLKLRRLFKIIDTNCNGTLSRAELQTGLKDFGLEISEDEFFSLWSYFDKDRSDSIDHNEFLLALRGPMNKARTAVVRQAFAKLDKTGDGVVTLADIKGTYDASKHPDVLSGKITPDEALTAFMSQWDAKDGSADGVVTLEEFCSYYDALSAGVEKDDYFVAVVKAAWKL